MSIGEDLKRLMRRAGDDALRQAAEDIRAGAAANVPHGDPSEDPDPAVALARAGEVTAHGDGFVISFSTPYAAKQHEDMRLRHPRGGQAKFLENELKAAIPRLEGIIASEVEKVMTGKRARR